MDASSGSGLIKSAPVSNTFTDSSGASKVLGLETDSTGHFLSDDIRIGKGNVGLGVFVTMCVCVCMCDSVVFHFLFLSVMLVRLHYVQNKLN